MKLDAPLFIGGPDGALAAPKIAAAGLDGAFAFEGPEDVFVPLARAAGVADLDLYSNVAIAFPRSPTHVAHTAWDLQRLSGGRFMLGLGSQVKAHVERRFGSSNRDWLGELTDAHSIWSGVPTAAVFPTLKAARTRPRGCVSMSCMAPTSDAW